ncbi:hypothetical protein BGZ63DRAFT_475764 [Mariannaea sp. PMI_226]|nr:hypothetical protein BGZ63DRAFT_475764 [Mariannaea sp. PMI_226]
MAEVTLYDNPSRFGTGTCWSPNVWKTRLLLNFKDIDYRTEWLHGPDIEPTLASLGIPPHKGGTEMVDYTVPAVRLPNGKCIMESLAIATAIEALYPEPKVHLDSEAFTTVNHTLKWVLMRLAPVLVPRMPRECLSGPTIAYHIEARKKTFGMSLKELEATRGGEGAWERARSGLYKLALVLKKNGDGPFCLGSTPSYADFLIVGFLEWCRCLKGDCFQRLISLDPVFGNVYNACEHWLRRKN